MALQTAQALMHSPRPVEYFEQPKQTTETSDPKQETQKLKCKERIQQVLDELVEVMRSAECTVGQGYLSNAEGNIRTYLSLFE